MSEFIAGERIEPGDALCRKEDGKIYAMNPRDDRSQENPCRSIEDRIFRNNEHLTEFLVMGEAVHCGDLLSLGIDSILLKSGVVWPARGDEDRGKFLLIGLASADWDRGRIVSRASIITHFKGNISDVFLSHPGYGPGPSNRQGGGDGPPCPQVPG